MRNLSIKEIIANFLLRSDSSYHCKLGVCNFAAGTLFSKATPIAFYDAHANLFVCLAHPFNPTGPVARHLREFHKQCPGAVRLPRLAATAEETANFYNTELLRTPTDDINKIQTLNSQKQLAAYYFSTLGVNTQAFNKIPGKPIQKHLLPSTPQSRAAKLDSYEMLIIHYLKYPLEYQTYQQIYTRSNETALVYRGSVLANYDEENDAYLIRVYDPRTLPAEIINYLITHAKVLRLDYLLVPDPSLPLSKQPQAFYNLQNTIALSIAEYRIDCSAVRSLSRAYAHIAAAREIFYAQTQLPEIKFTPDEDIQAQLKKYGAYRRHTENPKEAGL